MQAVFPIRGNPEGKHRRQAVVKTSGEPKGPNRLTFPKRGLSKFNLVPVPKFEHRLPGVIRSKRVHRCNALWAGRLSVSASLAPYFEVTSQVFVFRLFEIRFFLSEGQRFGAAICHFRRGCLPLHSPGNDGNVLPAACFTRKGSASQSGRRKAALRCRKRAGEKYLRQHRRSGISGKVTLALPVPTGWTGSDRHSAERIKIFGWPCFSVD